ncbi:hypothetical protein GCM10027445_44780 [Amycolatopsis endophytica]|uniref:Uncharacterized protein n=1 Tax=Amycolatopsis endophytica TaxID=860233 RepID=A0A853B0V1_9PSEU|nr:hypothetical protein [Amycolatopsis endophytica]NYI88630.1 hypothetical protein [Amycolatopsis endophytica]
MSSTDTAHHLDNRSIDERLQDLISRGYQFVHPRDAKGTVIAVVGVRAHDSVIDVVRLNAEDDVVATRMPGTEADILAPETVLWRTEGDAGAVLDKLLALPDGGDHKAGGPQPGGCWVATASGRATWLAAS